ncbi:MAG: hypothetical protein QXF95_08565 [Candidatus Caldarchaeum sp.]
MSEELSITDIYKKHKGFWVALLVTARDENGQPIMGKVVGVDIDRYRLRQQTTAYKELCVFYAGEPEYPLLV